MRLLASILFVLMSLILPMAGVSRNFCTMTMAFVSEEGECPLDAEECCCKEGKHKPSQPDCMIAAKPLPNADKSPAPLIPDADDTWVLLPATPAVLPPLVVLEITLALEKRGPPVIPDPLYLTQRRLLI